MKVKSAKERTDYIQQCQTISLISAAGKRVAVISSLSLTYVRIGRSPNATVRFIFDISVRFIVPCFSSFSFCLQFFFFFHFNLKI